MKNAHVCFAVMVVLCCVIGFPGHSSAASKGANAKEAARPNILYFYVDDMGWGSIGPNGQAARKAAGKPYVRTPNLDRLAAQGINFTRGYGCHVCSPARSSQQSGFHQGHTFADRNDPNNAKKAMRADDQLMGDVLSKAGYATGYWGKWGYGGSKDMKNPVIQNIQTLPTSHGYQYVVAELHHVRAHTFFQPTLWSAPAPRSAVGGLTLVPNSMARYRAANYPRTPAMQHDPKYPKTAYCDDVYAFAALDFVRKQGMEYNKSGKPFFGLFAAQIPHAPFDEISKLPAWNKAYANDAFFPKLAKQSQQWAAMVTRIDAHFGNILAALEDPNGDGDSSDSVADNTLVIFQSDNGGPGGKNNSELDANGGLSGTKGSIQEGGIRVPLIMRWTAKVNGSSRIKAGSNVDKVVDVTDLLPTFCELAGSSSPLGVDGVSIAPMLTGEGRQRHRDFIIHEAGNGQSIIQGRYKLVRSMPKVKRAKGGKKKNANKPAGAPKNQFKLFDLAKDAAEKKNIAANHPEKVKELSKLLLGERVTEPKGFANTYHHWTGGNDGKASDADNWSDYKYANAGITYTTDAGSPKLSWVAHLVNKGAGTKAAKAEGDIALLALRVAGNTKGGKQTLTVGAKSTVVGRNEIRVGQFGTLTLQGGTASSLRWVDVQTDGAVNGHGTIDATLYNAGVIAPSGTGLLVQGDYHQSETGALSMTGEAGVKIAGAAHLAGSLSVQLPKGSKATTLTVLTAKRISGKFSNKEVITGDGTRFTIGYNKASVTLKRN